MEDPNWSLVIQLTENTENASPETDVGRLVLGTAQLGMTYGIANRAGQPKSLDAFDIVRTAWDFGIRNFDTAQAYGQSEKMLADALKKLEISSDARVITKIDPSVDLRNPDAVRRSLEKSASLFGPAFSCAMLHQEEAIELWSEGLGEVLRDSRDQGLFRSIGASVYDPSFARMALETEGISMVQVPGNILDKRHEHAGVMQLARSLKKRIMIRSIFLQGALLLPVQNLPEQIVFASPFLEKVTERCRRWKVSVRDAALGFVRTRWPEGMVVFGVERPEQVKENVVSWKTNLPAGFLEELNDMDGDVPLDVVRPDLWDDPQPLITGSSVRLRPLRPSDAGGGYLKWMNDSEVTRFLESRFRSYTRSDLEQYILSQRSDPSVSFLAIEENSSGRHIGNLKIGPLNPRHETAEIGILIGAKDFLGRGFATEAIELAVRYAFTNFTVRKLTAGCYAENRQSARIFLKNGFVREGVRRQQVMDGHIPSDVILMGLLRSDWQKATVSP